MRLAVCICALALLPAHAFANDALDAGVAQLEEGEFEAALASFDEAESGALTRDDLVRLSTQRALAHHALGDEAAMQNDLTRLASLDPEGELPRAAPPPVREAFEAAQQRAMGGLSLDIRQRRRGGSVRLSARVAHDLGALVTEVTVSVRVQGSGEWIAGDPTSATVSVADGDIVEVRARAIGPGGAVLVERGADVPDRITIGEVSPVTANEQAVEESLEEGGDDGVAIALGILIPVALLGAGAAVLAYFLLQEDQGRDEISPPVTNAWTLIEMD